MNRQTHKNPFPLILSRHDSVTPFGQSITPVARLRKELRDRINHMMLGGFTYLQIINSLGEEGKDLNEQNLSNWKETGYTQWLKTKQRQDYLLSVQEAKEIEENRFNPPSADSSQIKPNQAKSNQIKVKK